MGKHRIWRKIAKKSRRKRIRRLKAQKRFDNEIQEQEKLEQSLTYIKQQKEQQALIEYEEAEEKRLSEIEHKKWLEREKEAQIQWQELQKRLEHARSENERQEQIIRKEWEHEQKLIAEEKRRREEIEEAKLKKQEELQKQIENFISNGGHLPAELKITYETNPDKEICPFFNKTGVCRFNDTCSRNHIKPGVSCVLLIVGFYSHFGLEQSNHNEYDTDISLEYDDEDTYSHFKEFYNDVYPEFLKHGDIVQFRVCRNFEPHLRGNVYVEYEKLQDSLKAYRTFHGRWYGGKQITVEFINLPSWSAAICGLFFKNRCPKGRSCNFLHIFLNPGEKYWYTFDKYTTKSTNQTLSHCRWSQSPELEIRNFKERKNSISRSTEEKYSANRKKRKRSRSKSRSRSKHTRSKIDSTNEKNHKSRKKSSHSHRKKKRRSRERS